MGYIVLQIAQNHREEPSVRCCFITESLRTYMRKSRVSGILMKTHFFERTTAGNEGIPNTRDESLNPTEIYALYAMRKMQQPISDAYD